jgi:hypothetical protein
MRGRASLFTIAQIGEVASCCYLVSCACSAYQKLPDVTFEVLRSKPACFASIVTAGEKEADEDRRRPEETANDELCLQMVLSR